MDERDDQQLLAALMAGEVSALATLVERYHAPLLGYLHRFVGGDRSLAEDLVQETFLRVLRQDSYQPGRPVRPWLYATATNLARDHFKSAAIRRTAPADDAALLAASDPAPGPEAGALAQERGREVARAVGQLGAEYRAVLLLRLYHELSLQEIAQAVGIPLGTVKSRLSVGLRRLRALLAGVVEGATCS